MQAEYINHMGDDITVVNAARVSMDKESEWGKTISEVNLNHKKRDEWEKLDTNISFEDWNLLSYLSKHNHFTPFTHCTITLRETVPIFVARQRFKHMVGFTYNEVSRRYVDDTPKFYTPDVWRKRAENVKQGSSDDEVDFPETVSDSYRSLIYNAYTTYTEMLADGVAPEQARMVLPQSMMTSYYVTGSLYAFARAYLLRIDPHAQKEIRDLAEQWDKIIRPLYPESWSALVDA